MSTPVGHLLLGAGIGAAFERPERLWRGAALGAFMAAAPDLDFLPGILLGEPSRFHHAASHSLAFAAGAALSALLAAPVDRLRRGALAGIAYASHLVLDFFTLDTSTPNGIPLLWPLASEPYASPLPLLPNVQHTSGPIVSLHNFALIGLEILLFAPLAWSAAVAAGRRGRRESASRAAQRGAHD